MLLFNDNPFLQTVTGFQIFISDTNNLHSITLLSNTNNF